MHLELATVLLLIRCLMLVVITITLGVYHDPSARHRWAVSIMATCAAGSSLGWCIFSALSVLQGLKRPEVMGEIWPTLFVLCFMIPVLYTRGNVAKLLPRVKWLHN